MNNMTPEQLWTISTKYWTSRSDAMSNLMQTSTQYWTNLTFMSVAMTAAGVSWWLKPVSSMLESSVKPVDKSKSPK